MASSPIRMNVNAAPVTADSPAEVLGINADGDLVRVPTDLLNDNGLDLPPGSPGQFLGYGPGGVPVAVPAPTSPVPSWDAVRDKPSAFPPSTHGHVISDIPGLQQALNDKQQTTVFRTIGGQTIIGNGDIPFPAQTDLSGIQTALANLGNRVTALEAGGANTAPQISTPIPTQSLLVGTAYSFNAASLFSDPDGDAITFSYTGTLPAGITRSGATFSGTATTAQTASGVLRGTDTRGLYVEAPVAWTVTIPLTAPSAITAPTISGGTTIGSILTRTAGTATGNPAPTRATTWLRNGTVIAGQTGNTLDTTGFAATDVITTRDNWTNSQGSASATSAGVTLTAIPTLTATVTPSPLIAGQSFQIVFSAAPDSATANVTLTGSGTTRSGTAPATGDLVIGATKAGYTAYSGTLTVQQPTPQLVEQNSQLVLRNVTSNTAPFQITVTEPTVYAGTYTITPAQFVSGPIWLVPPAISRNADVITLRPGLPIWLEGMEPVTRRTQWLRGTFVETASPIPGVGDQLSYTVDATSDGGMIVYAAERVEGTDGREALSISNGIAVTPVLTLPSVTSLVGIGDSITVGINATEAAQRWLNIASAAINSGTLTNAGVSGSVLQNSADSGGSARASNGRDRFVAAMTGSNKRDLAIVAYGFNDARYTAAPATFNVAAYQNDLSEVVSGLRIAGYPANRIVIVAPYWISDTGLATGSTGFTGQTRAGFEAFVAAARAVADEHGTLYHDAYAWMRDNGAATLIDTDNIHPNNAGHAKIAEGVLYHSSALNSREGITTITPSSTIAGRVDVTLTAVSGADSYQVERAVEGSFVFGGRVSVTTTSAALTGQTEGASLRVRARAVIGGQPGPWTYAASAVTVAVTSAPAATAPAAFGASDWSVSTGANPSEVKLSITALPSNGGSAITALQYRVGSGSWTALTGTAVGERVLSMAAPGTDYSLAVRAVNAVGNGAEGASKTAKSGAAATETSGWWYPGAQIDVDYTNDRARIGGVSYSSIAAAKTAGAIKTASDVSVDYIDFTLTAPTVVAASGVVVRSSSAGQNLFYLDDGADGVVDDESVGVNLLTTNVLGITVRKGASTVLNENASETYFNNNVAAAAVCIRPVTETSYWKTKSISGTKFDILPTTNRLCLGGRSVTNRPWLGTMKRVIVINAAVTDAEVDALVGAIQ